MLELQLDKAELKTINGHRYYVFPATLGHENYTNRPTKYADEKDLKTYLGKGSNKVAKLHPDVLTPAGVFMTALIEYGEKIDDWSMRSAVIQSGYRPDDAAQGAKYLRIIKSTIAKHPDIYGTLTFPANLEEDAQSVLGTRYDPKRVAFRQKVATSPGWTPVLTEKLFKEVDFAYAPRGSNPHATGFVFDLEFSVYFCAAQELKGSKLPCVSGERNVGADTSFNGYALQSAAGMWIEKYAMQYGFDSYHTGVEVWHLEYRKWK